MEDTPFSDDRSGNWLGSGSHGSHGSHWLGGSKFIAWSSRRIRLIPGVQGQRNLNEGACYHRKAIRANWFFTKRTERFMVFSLIFWIFVRQQIKIQRSHISRRNCCSCNFMQPRTVQKFTQRCHTTMFTLRCSHVGSRRWCTIESPLKVHTNRWCHRYDRVQRRLHSNVVLIRSSPSSLHG